MAVYPEFAAHPAGQSDSLTENVADCYLDFLDLLVVDSQDAVAAEELRAVGRRVHCIPTIMRKSEDRVALAKSVLAACGALPAKAA